MVSINSKNEEKLQVSETVAVLCPSESIDTTKVMSLTLDKLPEELILAIFYLLPKQEALSLSRTCSSCYTAYKAIPNSVHKHWLLQSLNLTLKTTTHRPYPDSTKQDWKLATLNIENLFESLSHCRPPGCKYQKYLRWLQGKKADCPIIRRTLVGLSMLPDNYGDLFHDKDQTKLNERSWKVLGWMFPECEVGYVHCDVGQYFEYEKFLKMMDFVLDSEQSGKRLNLEESDKKLNPEESDKMLDHKESDKRLRQIMAEYDQIQCRGWFEDVGFKNFVDKNDGRCSRQMGALIVLIQLGNSLREDDENEILYWAER